MKRLLLLFAVSLIISMNIGAQDVAGDVILLNYKTLEKKAAASDEAVLHEKKGLKSATWTKRGKVYQDVYNEGLEQVMLGSAPNTVAIFYGDPLSIEVDSNNVEIRKYETINYHFENGILRAWSRNNPINENPLDVAMQSYFKAVELTEAEKQMKTQEKLKDNLDQLKEQFTNSGQSKYFLGEYEAALEDFESILKINELPVYEGVIDTMMINFSGIVAREIGRTTQDEKAFRKSIKYYEKLCELGHGGSNTYVQMTSAFYAIGDTLGAIENLKKGLEKYPDSTLLVTATAQAFYLIHDNDGGIAFVDQRIEEKPNCAEAHYWKGILLTNHDEIGEDTINMALELYEKAIDIDPSRTGIWYQAGYVYYALGANFYEQEGYEDDAEFRDELKEKGKTNYEKAAVKLEKTYEIAGEDYTLKSESLDLLKRIYYKLYGGEDQRYLDVMEKIKAL